MENKIFTLHKTVTEADTAAHVGSGSLPVLATPVLIAWMEAAACGCCAGLMEEGTTSVGTEMNATYRGQPGGDESDCYGGTDCGGGQNSFFQGLCRRYRRCHRRGQPYPCHYTGGAFYGKGQCQAGPVREFP